MKLTDLNPRWLQAEDGRRGLGVAFDCPCKACEPRRIKQRVAVFFENPLDGKARLAGRDAYWKREGDDFVTLTITPSIDGRDFGHWHGTVRGGEIY